MNWEPFLLSFKLAGTTTLVLFVVGLPLSAWLSGSCSRWKFLIESVIITFVGGLIGVVAGSAVSFLISNSMSLPPTLSVSSVLLAFSVSAAIGILFGWYPARKAAALEPINALRYE